MRELGELIRLRENRKVFTLLAQDPDLLNAVDQDGNSLLHRAAVCGNRPVVEKLLNTGMPIWKTNADGNTAIDEIRVSQIQTRREIRRCETEGEPHEDYIDELSDYLARLDETESFLLARESKEPNGA